jgi:phosphoribosyl 1,2-cyclic phosphodiesterase
VRIHLCGVRGSTPAPGKDFLRYGGHTSCVAIGHDSAAVPTLILDAGTGVRNVTSLLEGKAFSGTILLTHLHWDHVQGLPFFQGGDRDDARVTLLLPAQPDGVAAEQVLAGAMSPPHFPIRPNGLRGDWTFGTIGPGKRDAEGFSVDVREIPHKGGRTLGYRVSDGRAVVAYVTDHCPTALGPGPDGWGAYHAAALELAAGADVLVHDAHLLAEEVAAEGSFGHAAADYAVGLAIRAGARRVVLFHHKPDRTDAALDELGRRFADAPVDVVVGAEGGILDT